MPPPVVAPRVARLLAWILLVFHASAQDVVPIDAAGHRIGKAVPAAGEPPVIDDEPVSLNATAGGHATFSVLAQGLAPLGFQWRKGTEPITDNGRVTGASTPVLNIDPVLPGDETNYVAVITSSGGAVTSSVVALTVNRLSPIVTPLGTTGALISVTGPRGDVYRVELSLNFGPWTTLGYATNITGRAEFQDRDHSGGFRNFRVAFDHMLPRLYAPAYGAPPNSFRAYGKLQQVWHIQRTDDFQTWISFATVTNMTGWIRFTDESDAVPTQRFYRLAPPL